MKKMPETMSLTRAWLPNEIASPTIPKPASSGPISTPTAESTISTVIAIVAPSDSSGRFKEGVFGGDKVEVLIQDLLIEADQEVVMSDAAELSPGRTLWEALGDIPDRRGAKGRRYPLRSVLTLSLAAMLAGGNDLCSIFRWGRRLPPEALYLLGLKRAPCHAMYHYFYKALTSTRPSTWPRPNRCWAPGRKGPVGRLGARVQTARNRGDRRQAPARGAPAGHDGSEGGH